MILDGLSRAIFWSSDAIFGPWTIALLFGTGLFLSFRYRFVQVTRFREAARTIVPAAEPGAKGPLSPYQAVIPALAGTSGTGR